MAPERGMIYIDGSNFYHGLKSHNIKTSINFEKFSRKLVGSRQWQRTYYYNAPVPKEQDLEKYENQQRFFARLYSTPYLTVRLGRLEKRHTVNPVDKSQITYFTEKGVDISVATDMLSQAFKNLYDTAILVSGDGDYAEVIEAVKDLGKHVEVAFTSTTYHLKKVADIYILLTPAFFDDCY